MYDIPLRAVYNVGNNRGGNRTPIGNQPRGTTLPTAADRANARFR